MKRKLVMLLAALVIVLGFTGCEEVLDALGLGSSMKIDLAVEITFTNSDSVIVKITNAGTDTKTYVLELTAGSWATSKLSDNLVVLAPGKTKVAYAYLTPSKDATAGQKVATLSVKSGNNVLKTVYLKANVVEESSKLSLRNGLEIALVVLVVILVIVGLILGFSRLRKDDDDEVLDEEGKTYY